MNIYSAAEIKAWEKQTIDEESSSNLHLIERAAAACFDWFVQNNLVQRPVYFLCGRGNNGADGLALAGRLSQIGVRVLIMIIDHGGAAGSLEFQEILKGLNFNKEHIRLIKEDNFYFECEQDAIVVDALYGAGLNRPLEGFAQNVVRYLNSLSVTVISLDLPSGLFADRSSRNCTAITATHTLSFQNYKAAFLFAENERSFGEVHLFDIGLSSRFCEQNHSAWEFIDEDLVCSVLRPRTKFSNKGDYGHALLVCGSFGMLGAAVLAARACLKTGVGKLTCLVPECGYEILQATVPEAMCLTSGSKYLAEIPGDTGFSAKGIGSGLSTHKSVRKILHSFLSLPREQLVLDADALNCISEMETGAANIPAGSVITPHPKEFARLFGKSDNNFQEINLAINRAAALNIYIVLKGHHTAIVTPKGKVYFNNTGNAGMAKAGMGDALTGMITGLIAQGYQLPQAAILGVYLHGMAGDLAASRYSQVAMQTSDLIGQIGAAWKLLLK